MFRSYGMACVKELAGTVGVDPQTNFIEKTGRVEITTPNPRQLNYWLQVSYKKNRHWTGQQKDTPKSPTRAISFADRYRRAAKIYN